MFELFLSILIWGVSGAASWWPLGCAGKLRWKGIEGWQHNTNVKDSYLQQINSIYLPMFDFPSVVFWCILGEILRIFDVGHCSCKRKWWDVDFSPSPFEMQSSWGNLPRTGSNVGGMPSKAKPVSDFGSFGHLGENNPKVQVGMQPFSLGVDPYRAFFVKLKIGCTNFIQGLRLNHLPNGLESNSPNLLQVEPAVLMSHEPRVVIAWGSWAISMYWYFVCMEFMLYT